MITQSLSSEDLRRALELAGRAPSVHNTQPWQFNVTDTQVDLYANLQRWLPATDADRRDLMISCGAALHHLRLALGSVGLGGKATRLFRRGRTRTCSLRCSWNGRPDRIRNWSRRFPGGAATDVPPTLAHPGRISCPTRPAGLQPGRGAARGRQPRPRGTLLNAFVQAEVTQGEVVGYSGELADVDRSPRRLRRGSRP